MANITAQAGITSELVPGVGSVYGKAEVVGGLSNDVLNVANVNQVNTTGTGGAMTKREDYHAFTFGNSLLTSQLYSVSGHWESGNGAYVPPPPPPTGGNCTMGAQVINLATGNRVSASTFYLRDNTISGGWKSTVFPSGYGPMNINYTHEYSFKSTETGYNESSITTSIFASDECDPDWYAYLTSYLMPLSGSTGNTTVLFYVYDPSAPMGIQGISGATVHLTGLVNQYGITGEQGTATFTTPLTGVLNWTVSAATYIGAEGTETLTGDVLYNVMVPLSKNVGEPTLTIPEADTSGDALAMVLKNASAITAFLILLFFVGGLKLMNKK